MTHRPARPAGPAFDGPGGPQTPDTYCSNTCYIQAILSMYYTVYQCIMYYMLWTTVAWRARVEGGGAAYGPKTGGGAVMVRSSGPASWGEAAE